jgi:RNA polymerase sigma-B factor
VPLAQPLVRLASGADSGELLARYAAGRDPRDREELVRRFHPLARRLALRYVRGGEPIDDLEQVALLGLLKALNRFDPSRGFAFTSFAVPTILGELKRSFRDTGWSAHVPRAVQERAADVRAATSRLSAGTGRPPRACDIAGHLGCTEEAVVEALEASSAMSALSLDTPRDAEQHGGDNLGDTVGAADAAYERVEDLAAITSALPSLTDDQRTAIELRFGAELKQTDIAKEMGVSQMQVSRLLRSGLHRLGTVARHQSAA